MEFLAVCLRDTLVPTVQLHIPLAAKRWIRGDKATTTTRPATKRIQTLFISEKTAPKGIVCKGPADNHPGSHCSLNGSRSNSDGIHKLFSTQSKAKRAHRHSALSAISWIYTNGFYHSTSCVVALFEGTFYHGARASRYSIGTEWIYGRTWKPHGKVNSRQTWPLSLRGRGRGGIVKATKSLVWIETNVRRKNKASMRITREKVEKIVLNQVIRSDTVLYKSTAKASQVSIQNVFKSDGGRILGFFFTKLIY